MFMGIPSESIFGLITTVLSFWMERDSRKICHEERQHEMDMQRMHLEMVSSAAAEKRVPRWVRTVTTFIIIAFVFGGIFYFSFRKDISIQYVYEVPQKAFLGLIKWGKTLKVETLEGFPIFPFITHSIAQIMGFTFGRVLARRN